MLLQIFKAILLTSAVGSILTIMLLLIKPITKRYFGSAWQYYVWLTVLIVMMLPVTFQLPQTTPAPIPSQTVRQHTTDTAIQTETTGTQTMPIQATNTTPFYDTVNKVKNFSIGITDIICYIWLIGCLLILGLNIIKYSVFLRTIRKNSVIVFCPEIGTDKITTRRTSMIDAPLMIGLFRPTLLLPDLEMTQENLNYIILHELTHHKRHDLLYKWFAMLVNTVHWFNPFAYIVSNQIDEECETSCDLSIVADMNEQQQAGYMNTILILLSSNKAKKQMLTTAMASNKKQIKRRFMMIRNATKKSKIITLISVIAACAILASTVFASGILSNISGGKSHSNSNKGDNKNDLQNIVMQEYSKYNDATFIFMNPSTGEILACAGDIEKLIEPPSIFDYIPLSIALNEQLVSLEDSFECTGSIDFGNLNINCWKHEGHGIINIADAVNVSCNIAIIKAIEQLDKSAFYKYLENFGIANSNNSIFHNKNTFGDIEARITAMGQGFQVKPLQILLDYAALVNGGNIPRVYIDENNEQLKSYNIKDYVNNEIISVITPETSEQILKAMSQNTNSDDILTFGGQADILPREIPKYVYSAIAIAPTKNPDIIGIALGSSEDIENIGILQNAMKNILNNYYNSEMGEETQFGLGFAMTFPPSWQSKGYGVGYVKTDLGVLDNMMEVYHIGIRNKYGEGTGRLFSISKYDERTYIDFAEPTVELGSYDGCKYYFHTPSDVQHPVWDGGDEELVAEYESMAKDIPAMRKSIKLGIFATAEAVAKLSSLVDDLYQYKNTNIGDHSTIAEIVDLLPKGELIRGRVAYETFNTPYGIGIYYKIDDRKNWRENSAEYVTMEKRSAAILFALIPNMDSLRIDIRDRYNGLTQDDRFAGSYTLLENLNDSFGTDYFTKENLQAAVATKENFKAYVGRVMTMEPAYNWATSNSVHAIYNTIGEGWEVMTNSGMGGTFVLEENVVAGGFDLAQAMKESNIDITQYYGKKIDVQTDTITNYAGQEPDTSYAFVFCEGALIAYKNIGTDANARALAMRCYEIEQSQQ